MLSTSTYKLAFDDYEPDWTSPTQPPQLYRSSSVKSWGVTSIGRGFDWDEEKNDSFNIDEPSSSASVNHHKAGGSHVRKHHHSQPDKSPVIPSTSPSIISPTPKVHQYRYPFSMTDIRSTSPPLSESPNGLATAGSFSSYRSPTSTSSSPVPPSPRPRRRSSQQRVSLIAGRVSIAPIEPPSPPPLLPQSLRRTPSSGSVLSTAASTRPPSPAASDNQSFIGGRSISEFEIEGEIGRGAYGLVKRAREICSDGSLGVRGSIYSDHRH